ncbi:MAG: glycosyltransferase [Mogibacterium kristiansenii]|uniref:glycosyltransferase n=1 Tax=Mogibacterium kristiansenii TaxID=2606708 RepID=UPI003F115CF4
MKKVCVIGHFGFGKNLLNGQTIKTENVTRELEKQYGEDQIIKIDTHGGVKALPQLIMQMIEAFKHSENVVIFPAHNGVKIFVPLCNVLNAIFKRKVHYIVIGGWLPSFLNGKCFLKKNLMQFDGIYVETNTMKKALMQLGLNNVVILKNFKDIKILSKEELQNVYEKPYKICTFSRVMLEKGIEDIVNTVISINEKNRKPIYCLDIYGQIDANQEEWFAKLRNSFPSYISYKGSVPTDKSVEVLKNYFLLTFPTKFYTEGVPGTILDAYAAGVPVIASKWESFFDVIEEGKTGIGYEFDNQKELEKTLEEISSTPRTIIEKKYKCIEKAKEYLPRVAIRSLLERL